MNSLNKVLLIIFIALLVIAGITFIQNKTLENKRKESLNIILEEGSKQSEESIKRIDRIHELENQINNK